MNEEIYERLRQLARTGGLTHYGIIAPLADLDMSQPQDRAEIGRMLGEISTREDEEGRPLLSAIVVHQIDGRPGQGFFVLARHLGVIRPDEDEEAYWQREVERVHEYWRTH